MSKSYEEIVKECNELIPRDVISTREGGSGKRLSYLEGWYVIDRLNQVFGQGAWAYSSECHLLHTGTIESKYGPSHTAHYSAKVRLVVTIGDKHTEFTDYGYGDGQDKVNPGKAHELAIKEAVTDGLKRAARCLGNSFGNGLYDKSGEGIQESVPQSVAKPPVAQAKPVIAKSLQVKEESREQQNLAIRRTMKVLIDKKLNTIEGVKSLLEGYGAKTVDELSDVNAQEVLLKLKEKINVSQKQQ